MCIMKVSRERLQIIGKMISVLREEKRQNKQNNWTQIKFCENICSPNTLKSIESGKVGRLDAIYEQLLEKLGLKYGEFPVIDEAIDKIVDELYDAVEFFDKAKIKTLTNKALKILETVRDYVYYSDLYQIMNDISNYYLFVITIDEKKCEHSLLIMDNLKYKLKDILKIIVFAGIKQKCTSDLDIYNYYIKELDFENTYLPCAKINLLLYYHVCDERFKFMELTKELESIFIKENNDIRLLAVYNAALSCLSLIDESMGSYYRNKVLELVVKENIPNIHKSESYANIAFGYHNQGQFREALDNLNKCVTSGCVDLLTTYIFIADCQNRLELKIKIPKLKKEIIKNYPRELRVMYNYFLQYEGEEVPAIFKQKNLMKYVAPLLVDTGFIKVFRFELTKLIKETSSYKDLFVFDEMVKKNKG